MSTESETPAQEECRIRSCPDCGADNSRYPRLRYSRDDWNIKRCPNCRFVYLENPTTEESLRSELAWEKSIVIEAQRKRRESRRIRYFFSDSLKRIKVLIRGGHRIKVQSYILRHIGPGRILDVGCGDGRSFQGLPAEVIPFGIDLSEELARRSDEIFSRAGGRVVWSSAFDGLDEFDPDFFDGIVMRAYLEHETRPRAVLQKAVRVLRPGGRIVIKVPNYGSINRRFGGRRWCGFRFPDHVNYFTPSSLRSIVHSAGLRVAHFGILGHFPLNDNMWLVAEKPAQDETDRKIALG